MGKRGARGVQRGQHVHRIHPLPGVGLAIGDPLEGKAAGDIYQRVQLAEMRRRRIDRLFGLRRIGEIDAAELEPFEGRQRLRQRAIDACHAGATRERRLRDDLAERAERTGDDKDFSIHLVVAFENRKKSGPAADQLGLQITLFQPRAFALGDVKALPEISFEVTVVGTDRIKTRGEERGLDGSDGPSDVVGQVGRGG